jgi:hypothetical protein
MIISAISLQMTFQTAFVEHDQVIQALPANAGNPALNMSSLAGERGADRTCSIPIAFNCCTNSWPKMRSRSRSK